MTPLTTTILARFQVRKTRRQKAAFLEWAVAQAVRAGYPAHIERGTFGSRNLVIGSPQEADVVFAAHYDTCAKLPFANLCAPKNLPVFLLLQGLIFLFVFVPAFGSALAWRLVGLPWAGCVSAAVALLLMGLLFFGPANPHTANDNTSGVATVLGAMQAMPEALRPHAAFVLFDLEELGLLGSSSFYSAHKETMDRRLLVNFDCVGDGRHMLFAVRKGARRYLPQLRAAFSPAGGFAVEMAVKGVFYPSDQLCFPCAAGVVALKRAKRFHLLYLGRIHTRRDTECGAENIAFLVQGAVRLVRRFAANP